MRVGLLTSWRVPCGVYQFSARLADALAQLPDVQPVILAGRADEHRSVPEESEHEVRNNVAKIGLWRDDQTYHLDQAAVLEAGLDVLHVQYQCMLLNQEPLGELAEAFEGVTAITYHDRCIRGDFPFDAFDLHFSHRWNIGPPIVEDIPFGIEDRAPVVRSFGLGRSRDDYIGPICERHGWTFESAASHEPIHGGNYTSWRTHAELIDWLRGADAIVLWYDPQDLAGSSQAARTAMASRRPVFTNDTQWFSDLPPRAKGFRKVSTLDQLEDELVQQFERPFVEAASWNTVAKYLVGRYQQVAAEQERINA